MYVRNNLKYDRYRQYESENDSNICIKVGFPQKRKIFIYGLYRQWSLPTIVNSCLVSQQVLRWKQMLNNISDICDQNVESYVIGDYNLNVLSFNKNYELKTQHEKT